MRSNEVFRIIDEVAGVSSTKDKLAILTKYKDNQDLVEVLKRTYSPFITYGIKLDPNEYGHSTVDALFNYNTMSLLDALAYRQLTGNAAREEVKAETFRLGKGSADLLVRIINGDLRAGINTSTINKVWPGLIPELPYMRCTLPHKVKVTGFDWDEGVYSQVKADGMFANCAHSLDGEVRFTSRQGHEIPLVVLHDDVRRVLKAGTVSMGELLVYVENDVLLPRKDGNALINSLADNPSALNGYTVVYHVWDQVPVEVFVTGGHYAVPYKLRYAALFSQVNVPGDHSINLIHTVVVYSEKEARRHAVKLQADGGEGTVYKDPNAPWIDGTSKWQVKLKVEFTVDLEIIGFTKGTGKRAKDFGALVCATSDRLLQTDVAGLKEADYARINSDREGYLGTIVAVTANDLSEVGTVASLMHPRVAEFRKDKVVADTLQQVRDQLEAARNGGV